MIVGNQVVSQAAETTPIYPTYLLAKNIFSENNGCFTNMISGFSEFQKKYLFRKYLKRGNHPKLHFSGLKLDYRKAF